MALLWVIAIALLVFWAFGLFLDFLGALIWIFLIAAIVVLAIAAFRMIAGRST